MDTRVESIEKSYRAKSGMPDPEPPPAGDWDPDLPESNGDVVDETPDPTVTSPKPVIIDWLLACGIESPREDLEAMTRAQLFENFVDV